MGDNSRVVRVLEIEGRKSICYARGRAQVWVPLRRENGMP